MQALDTFENVTPQLNSLKAAGYDLIGRYYSKHGWKVMEPAEAQAITKAGLKMFVVYEDANNSVDQFDAVKGTANANKALELAKGVGQPKGSAIYFAVDYDAEPADIAGPIADYFRAVRKVFDKAGSPYRIGVYGGGALCSHLLDARLADFAWLCQSTGFPGYDEFYRSGRWSITQMLPKNIAGLDCDPDKVNPNKPDVGQFDLAKPADAPMLNGTPIPLAQMTASAIDLSVATAYPGAPIGRGEFHSNTVKLIQRQLSRYVIPMLVVDGDFGEATENAVRLFQSRHVDAAGHSLAITGVVDEPTWLALFGKPISFDPGQFSAATELRSLVVAIASTQIGALEDPIGSNRGPQVDEYIKAAGITPGTGDIPWCVCFIQWVFRAATSVRGEHSPLPLTAGVHALWQMRNQGATHVVKPSGVSASDIRPGMLFLIDTGGGKGHAGIIESIEGDRLVTIEGNTNDGGGREGYGVFRRTTRRLNMGALLGYLDFC